ncbi:MAG: hypothetical protein WAK95_04150 [Desulfobacterales bacterium]
MRETLAFYALKLPLIFTLIIVGLTLDFFVQLPYRIMCTVDRLRGKRY